MVLALLIQLATWLLVGLLLGVLAYVAAFVVVQPLDRQRRERVGDFYLSQTMRSIRQGAVVATQYGYTFSQIDYDSDRQSQAVKSVDDAHVEDKGRLISRLSGRPFAIIDDRFNAVADPQYLQICHHAQEEWLDGRSEWAPDDGDGLLARIHYRIPDRPEIVSPSAVEALQTGAADPETADHARENAIKSQEKFGRDMSLTDIMLFGILYLIGSASIWFMANYGSNASEAATPDISLAVGVIPI